ncbi:MAG: DUF1127 domain-containing protein [Acetobacteraceae bacterium]|nr:DUF1127 domain-containing protein [Acetobacteraceae bacterium]
MSAPIAKDQIVFQLPKLTYINARYEEPNLHYALHPAKARRSLRQSLADFIVALRKSRQNRAALAELEMMSDRELRDMGISRADFSRIFDPQFSRDLDDRGSFFPS